MSKVVKSNSVLTKLYLLTNSSWLRGLIFINFDESEYRYDNKKLVKNEKVSEYDNAETHNLLIAGVCILKQVPNQLLQSWFKKSNVLTCFCDNNNKISGEKVVKLKPTDWYNFFKNGSFVT